LTRIALKGTVLFRTSKSFNIQGFRSFFALASQKSCFLEAEVSQPASNRLSHDHVIKELDLENSCGASAVACGLCDLGNVAIVPPTQKDFRG